MGSVPNCQKEIPTCHAIRWFKCKLKPPKNASKILDSVGKPSYNQVRLQGSKYQDVELALLYWLKDMRSKDVLPPITLTLLRGKAEKYDIFLISLNEYIKSTFGQISTQ